MRWVTQGPEHKRLDTGKTPGGHAWYLRGWKEAELGGARPRGEGPVRLSAGVSGGARRGLWAGLGRAGGEPLGSGPSRAAAFQCGVLGGGSQFV